MKKIIILLVVLTIISKGYCQNVGIGVTTPVARLHVADSSVLFSGSLLTAAIPGPPPIEGAGIRMMWYPDKAAFRFGGVDNNQWNKDSIGDYSFASGKNNTAIGQISFASGERSYASGATSFALGFLDSALGNYSIAAGYRTVASGTYSFTIGIGTKASGHPSFASGTGTIATGDASTVIGSSTIASGTRSFAGGYLAEASGISSFAFGNSANASGDYSTAIGVSTIASGARSFAGGFNAEASGINSFAFGGLSTLASGDYSFAIGKGSLAIGTNSIAMGINSNSSGYNSNAIGNGAKAIGWNSTAIGLGASAKSYCSVALGIHNDTIAGSNPDIWIDTDPLLTIGNGLNGVVLNNAMVVLKNGKIGIGTNTPQTKLQIQGGSDATYSSNSGYLVLGNVGQANVVYDDNEIIARFNGLASDLLLQPSGGNVGIGITDAQTRLHVDDGSDASYAATAGYMVLGNTAGLNVVFDNNEILARNNGAAANLTLQNNGGDLNLSPNGNVTLCANGGNVVIGSIANPTLNLQLSNNSAGKPGTSTWNIVSDARLKKNVHDYRDGLNELLKIRPVWFTYTGEAGMPKETYVGILAQELKTIAPYMVNSWNYTSQSNQKTEYLGVDNGAMTYMLINAVKEQQAMIEELKKENLLIKTQLEKM